MYGVDEATVHALAGIEMSVDKNKFVAIMGHSGSGKSTLMNILGCLDLPTSGSYMFDGRDVSKLRQYRLKCVIRNLVLFFNRSTSSAFERACKRHVDHALQHG